MDLHTLSDQARKAKKESLSFFKSIKKSRMRELDDTVHQLHETITEQTDCLACANCCRTLGPRVTDKDIARMARALRMKPHEVVQTYLRVDEDNDYVFQTMPCPFLADDNYCFIYEDRPKACREYPHTDRRKFHQIHKLSIRNAETCPVVHQVIERLKKEF